MAAPSAQRRDCRAGAGRASFGREMGFDSLRAPAAQTLLNVERVLEPTLYLPNAV